MAKAIDWLVAASSRFLLPLQCLALHWFLEFFRE